MGENLALNMASKGFSVAVYNRTSAKTQNFVNGRGKSDKIEGFTDIARFVGSLETPRRIMMMLKAGDPVDQFIEQLLPHLEEGDIIIDGGNSSYHDTNRRLESLEKKGLCYIGTGVSGGEEGALKGPSIMPGGSVEAWPYLKDILKAISAQLSDGSSCCDWMGPAGAGHFVKMVHNGIEYGDMQLICEAYQFMKDVLNMSHQEIHAVFVSWGKGDLESYLIEITADITGYLDENGMPLLDRILDTAGQKGTGKWTVNAGLDHGLPLSLISESVFARCLSSNRELRLQAAEVFTGKTSSFNGDHQTMIAHLATALYCAKIISYAQGFGLLQAASESFGWNLNYSSIARIWRGGCIIRSVFLDLIAEAYQEYPHPANMLLAPYFRDTLQNGQTSLREVLAAGIRAGVPLPCHSAAIAYFDGFRSGRLPANLLQAQRDYFGAHMYERTDQPRGRWFHTNWTGSGGNTTSTTYST